MSRVKGIGRIRRAVRAVRLTPAYIELLVAGERRSFGIRTDVTREELVVLYRLAKGLKGGDIVEIGSYLGATACFLAAGAAKSGACVHCVDTWRNDAMSEGARETFEEFVLNTKHHAGRINAIRGWSTDAARSFDGEISLLFVDGDHSQDAVAADLAAWLPKVATGGWIAMHDSGWAEGVQAAIANVLDPIRMGNPIELPNLYAARIRQPQ